MKLKAKDVMVQDYVTVRPTALVSEAARLIFEGRVRETGYKPLGIMVTDEIGRLVGMISMMGILYHVRPTYMNFQAESTPVWEGELDFHLEQFSELRVGQIMSTPVFTVAPEDDLFMVIDQLVKKRVRRLPVVARGKIVGIVYLSDVFHALYESWIHPKGKGSKTG
jgi:CBS-domain-containing membrane protein